MRRIIYVTCRQALTGTAFLLAVAGVTAVLGLASFESIYSALQAYRTGLLYNGFHIALLQSAFTSDLFVFALPILAAVPYTAAYLDDIRSGFVKEYLPRTCVRDYIAGKLAACLLSGGLALVLGLLLFYGLASLVFLPMEAAPEPGIEASSPGILLLADSILAFGSGAFWSLVGMTMAAVTGSRYMAYASPFILYYVLIILCERYFTGLYIFYPKEWLQPRGWTGGVWGVVVLLAELTVLCGCWFGITAKKRLEQL